MKKTMLNLSLVLLDDLMKGKRVNPLLHEKYTVSSAIMNFLHLI